MADVTWDKQGGRGNSDVFEVALNATDKTTPVLVLDPAKHVTIAVKTTGSATVAITLFLEDPDNASPVSYTYDSDAATASGDDYIRSALGPLAGIDIEGTITGGDTATVQVIASERD